VLGIIIDDGAGDGFENQLALVPPVVEFEHIDKRAADAVDRTGPWGRCAGAIDEAEVPIILDKAQDRGLVGQRMIDEVRLRPGRDHEQRQSWAKAASFNRPRSSRVTNPQPSQIARGNHHGCPRRAGHHAGPDIAIIGTRR
jgi:hypothetical protein